MGDAPAGENAANMVKDDVTGEMMLAGVAPGTPELELRHGEFETLHEPALAVPPDRGWIELVMRRRPR